MNMVIAVAVIVAVAMAVGVLAGRQRSTVLS